MATVIREDLSRTPLQRCLEAIDAGDKEAAKQHAQAIWDEGRPLHDLYVDMSGLFATYIKEKLGEDAVEECWRFIGEQVWKPVLMQVKEAGGTELLVNVYAQFLRAHGHEFTVVQDEEKTQFLMHVCGSGGMLMRDGHNANSDRHPVNIAVSEVEHPRTFNEKGISMYCMHTPLWMDMQPREWGWDVFKSTFGRQFDEHGVRVDAPCVCTIYHKPQSEGGEA